MNPRLSKMNAILYGMNVIPRGTKAIPRGEAEPSLVACVSSREGWSLFLEEQGLSCEGWVSSLVGKFFKNSRDKNKFIHNN